MKSSKASFHLRSFIPPLPHVVVGFARRIGRIFFIGFLLVAFLGVGFFYFFAYRFTQQAYISTVQLQGVNRVLLIQVLGRLHGQQSKAVGAPSTNPFE